MDMDEFLEENLFWYMMMFDENEDDKEEEKEDETDEGYGIYGLF